jgi:hypothetical protein
MWQDLKCRDCGAQAFQIRTRHECKECEFQGNRCDLGVQHKTGCAMVNCVDCEAVYSVWPYANVPPFESFSPTA